MKILKIGLDECTGCKACVTACSLEKGELFSPTISRINIHKDEATCLAIATICEHCPRPPCHLICPTRAIVKDHKMGLTRILAEKCDGCGLCVKACPFSAIRIKNGLAFICDLCGGEPNCAAVCMPRAIKYVDADRTNITKKWVEAKKRMKALKDWRSR